jgi:hypothetical protein
MQHPEHWEDRERSDLALFMLRLQLLRLVLEQPTVDLSRLYPGLELGTIVVPTDGYTINKISEHLSTAGFKRCCLNKAGLDRVWAYLGPGNYGPDAWLILFSAAEQQQPVCVFLQSKKRKDVLAKYHRQYPAGALAAEAEKCWSVKGVPSCLLYLTDERGRDKDRKKPIPENEPLYREEGVGVVPVSRGSYLHTYGVALETLKRCREAWEHQEKKRRV